MWRVLILLNLLLAFISTTARATDYDVRFCVEVSLDLVDPGVGDRWTLDGENKPARGFSFSVTDQLDPVPSVSDGHLFEGGPYVGCTPLLSISDTVDYHIHVWSHSEIEGHSISVADTDLVSVYEDFHVFNYTPSADRTEILVIDGCTPSSTTSRLRPSPSFFTMGD